MLLFIYKKQQHTGTTAAAYLVWYGLGRTWIEGLRSDSLYIGSSGIRVSQLLSMVLVIVGIVILSINIVKSIKSKKGKING